MERYPTRWTCPEGEEQAPKNREQAIRFLLHVLSATIYSSGDDYDQAVDDFFPQLEALGHLIGASDIEEVSDFLRQRCRFF